MFNAIYPVLAVYLESIELTKLHIGIIIVVVVVVVVVVVFVKDTTMDCMSARHVSLLNASSFPEHVI